MKGKDVLNSRSTTLPPADLQFLAALKKMVEIHHRLEHSKLKLEAAWNTVHYHLDRMEHQEYMGLMAKIGL
jgi:hypothetical protein